MSRCVGSLAPILALALVAVVFVLPVGSFFLRSFEVNEVVLKDGRVVPAVGDVEVLEDRVVMLYQSEPGARREQPPVRPDDVAEVRTRLSLRHYRFVFEDPRTLGLVKNSLLIGGLGALAALLLGLPLAWLLFRTGLPGRPFLLALCLGPAILPPFLVGMGGARRLMNVLSDAFDLEGAALQVTSATVIFGFLLSPLVMVLVGRALAGVPAGSWEAARLLGGRRAATLRVVLPAVLPAVYGAAALTFVIALADWTVPDLLSFLLPPAAQTQAKQVFPTEIFSQWDQHAVPRAVATGAPFVLIAGALLVLALFFLRKSPVVAGGEGERRRSVLRLPWWGRVVGWVAVLAFVTAGLFLPLVDMANWASGQGESAARSGDVFKIQAESRRGELFDFAGAIERTPHSGEATLRWLRTGVVTALLATFIAVVLARWALRGGGFARGVVLVLGVAPLAVPALLYSAATTSFWNTFNVPGIELTVLRSAFALTARFLPFALLAAWIVLRQVRPQSEEAAALLGAGRTTRALRVWGPPTVWGIAGGALAVLVLALREIETVVTIDNRILPLRIYDKIHYSRLADEANLSFLYLGLLLVPALLAAVVWMRPWRWLSLPPGPNGRS